MSDDMIEAKDFELAEYREAANAYFKGVDIGYTTVRNYITINVLFAALIGAISERASPVFASAGEMVKLVPWFALSASLALLFALPYYFRHLENCRLRCEEIERAFGGKLFTRLGVIAHRRRGFNTVIGLMMIIGTVSAFWLYFAAKSYDPNFQLFEWIKGFTG